MPVDLSIDLLYATVRIAQQLPSGKFGQGTGFLVEAPKPDGTPRVVMVTADHVFSTKMLGDEVQIGLRQQGPGGDWSYAPAPLPIRGDGTRLWTKHPHRDIAVITVQVPPEIARAAIPLAWLAEADTFARTGLRPGDTLMAMGFPLGLSSTKEGFAILRTGALASFPNAPVASHPSFLMDAPIAPGNSGGPVFVARGGVQFVAGVVTQQVESEGRALDLGVITHAVFVRETIEAMDAPAPAVQTAPEPVG